VVTASKLCFTIEVTFSSWRASFLSLDVIIYLFKLRNTARGEGYHRTDCLNGIKEGSVASAITIQVSVLKFSPTLTPGKCIL
jgi:hypothetical protein